MPSPCCIPGCNSNYLSALKAGEESVSVFRLPKDENLKIQWLKTIPRANWSPTIYSVVCAKHFIPSDIIREDIYLLPDGTTKKIPSKVRLNSTAVPCIFPNLSAYLSKTVPIPRKSPEERNKEHQERTTQLNQAFEQSDCIKSFEDLLNYPQKINVSEFWEDKIGPENDKNYQDKTIPTHADDHDPNCNASSEVDNSFQTLLDDYSQTPSLPAQKGVESATMTAQKVIESATMSAQKVVESATMSAQKAVGSATTISTVTDFRENDINTENTADEFELFGKTVAAHLRELPLHEALESEAYIMKYLVEKRLRYSSSSGCCSVSDSCYKNETDDPEIKIEFP